MVSGLTLLSRIIGLGRDMLMAGLFGTGWILDTFTLAFRIPGMFRRLFGEGAMTAAFLPRFVEEDRTAGRQAASDLFSAVARQLFRWLGWIVVVCEVGLFIVWLSTDLSDRSELLVQLTILLLPYSLLICLAALYCAALNGVQHFTVPALLPVALNVVWLTGGLLTMQFVAADDDQVRVIAATILLGGIAQLLLSVHQARRHQIRVLHHAGTAALQQKIAQLFRDMGPVLFGLSIIQLNALVDSVLAWLLALPVGSLPVALHSIRLQEGTAAALYLGQRMFQFPLGVFGVALGTVLFPRFARHVAAADRHELGQDILHGLQLVLVVAIPASVGLWLVAEPMTDLLFRRGAFDAQDSALTVRMVAAYGLGVWVFSGLLIVNRVFYAAGDQLTPARHGLICLGLNLVLSVALLPVLRETALPAASVLATLCQLALALKALKQRAPATRYRAYIPVLWRTLVATALMTVVFCGVQPWLPQSDSTLARFLRTAIPVASCVAVYWASLQLIGLSVRRLMAGPFQPSSGIGRPPS